MKKILITDQHGFLIRNITFLLKKETYKIMDKISSKED
jgi:hypothetical protein